MGPGGFGGFKSPDASAAIGEIEQKKTEVTTQISEQQKSAVRESSRSIESQLKDYRGRREGILSAIAGLKSRLAEIPDIPQAQSAKDRLKEQVEQMRKALAQINTAIGMIESQKQSQQEKISTEFGKKKKEIVGAFDRQKAEILTRIAAQKIMMQDRMQQMMAAQGQGRSPEGGKVKG